MFLKLAQILMVTAIFNPFCCCTAAVVAAVDAGSKPATPGCCQSNEQNTSPNTSPAGSEHHDPANCPHTALKDYQGQLFKDASAKQLLGHDAPVLVALPGSSDLFLEPLARDSLSTWHTGRSPAPPRALAPLYCVYRI